MTDRKQEVLQETAKASAALTAFSLPHLQVAVCRDAQAVAGAAEVLGHGGDEAHLTFKPGHFEHLQQQRGS